MAYYNASRPRYGFGCGLSYTAFHCRLEAAGEEGVSFTLTNTGGRGGLGRCHSSTSTGARGW